MKKILVLVTIALLFAGCVKSNDEQAVLDLINSSIYVGDGATVISEDDQPTRVSTMFAVGDTLPFVLWRRIVKRPTEKNISIDLVGDSAYVTIDYSIEGTFYVINLTNTDQTSSYQRVISDTVHREIVVKKIEGKWKITAITPLELWTKDKAGVRIDKAEVIASPSGGRYTIEAGKLYTKEELPTFDPGDTVKVTVYLKTDDGKGWVFLHHGIKWRKGGGIHHRKPFEKEDDQTFTGTWIIADDSIVKTPALRNSAIDAVGEDALFGDSTAEYNAHALLVPYIIKKSDEEIPVDEEAE